MVLQGLARFWQKDFSKDVLRQIIPIGDADLTDRVIVLGDYTSLEVREVACGAHVGSTHGDSRTANIEAKIEVKTLRLVLDSFEPYSSNGLQGLQDGQKMLENRLRKVEQSTVMSIQRPSPERTTAYLYIYTTGVEHEGHRCGAGTSAGSTENTANPTG
jgi:hypothetical protein